MTPSILIADDSSFVRNQISIELEKMGIHVTRAENGKVAMNLIRTHRFDLVITDVEMPLMDGFQLCRALKDNPDTRALPVIILSSRDSDSDIDKGFQAGASAYVSKAEAKDLLNDTVEKVLRKSSFHRDQLILVVDDSPTILTIVTEELEKAGFRVISAITGKDALELTKAYLPDLILSDIEMPGMNGIEFCKAVKKRPEFAAIPFVIMSSKDDRSTMRRMFQMGASAYMVKPFNLEQLVITIEKLLSDHFLLLLKEKERLDVERRMMLASITSLIVALEARDHYTRGHSEAVATLTMEMAKRIGQSSDEIEAIGIAGRLHDIGKIGVPDTVLLKPGRLTDEDYRMIRQHPVIGANILGSISSLEYAIPVIRHHHEHFDGSGYPDNLKGRKIPYWARMTAVADTYHALISDRPYRAGMPREKAPEIIKSVRGTQLCPESIDIFLQMIPDLPQDKFS